MTDTFLFTFSIFELPLLHLLVKTRNNIIIMCIGLLCSIRRTIVISSFPKKIMASRQSSDMTKFREALKSAKDVVILSGAGISAESGIPTFRGAGGYWRKYQSSTLATPGAFRTSPSLVWEFYHYRREVAAKAQPNAGHIAIAQYEAKYGADKKVTVITQNVDGLHVRAGTKNLIELHGNLYKTRCTKCKEVLVNNDSPICEDDNFKSLSAVASRNGYFAPPYPRQGAFI